MVGRILPKSVIQRNLNSSNLIGFVSPFCYSNYSVPNISLASNKFVEYLDYYINDTPVELENLDNFVSLTHQQSSRFGSGLEFGLDLTAALGVGAGIKLGFEYAYMDELSYPVYEYAIVKNRLLPLHEFETLAYNDRLFAFSDEIDDIFEGTALLIEEPLKALEEKIEKAIEAGQEFVLKVFNTTARISGTINNTGRFIVRKISSAIKRTKKTAFMSPQIIHAYTSNKVITQEGSKKNFNSDEDNTLYIISDHINVSLIDNSNNVIMDFNPVNMSIATDPSLIQELSFSDGDLNYAKMYYYDDEQLCWIEIEGDLNPALDTVETQISRSGTYAVGVNYTITMDHSAVEILQYYPENLQTIHPNDTLWVSLFEAPAGSGIDFAKTAIFIDGVEVDSEWNPMVGRLRYIPAEPIPEGDHSFVVNVYDNNGNTSTVAAVFKVQATNIDYSLVMRNTFEFKCYPNPTREYTTISIYNPGEKEGIELSLFNISGELIGVYYNGDIAHGLNEFVLRKDEVTDQSLIAGVYFIRLIRNGSMTVKKLIFE